MELTATLSSEAAAQISSQIVEQVAKAAVEPDRLQAGVGASVAFVFDGGDFGTVPPRPRWGVGRLSDIVGRGALSRMAVAASPQADG